MKVTASIVLAYALLVLMGGWIGYMKASSTASLFSGLLFGTALLLGAYGIYKEKILAQYLTLFTTFFLDGFFTYRFAKTQHFMPAGLMS